MTKKEIAQQFLKLASKGQVREAFVNFISADFKHHNVYSKGDAESLLAAMEENSKKAPDKVFKILRTLEDGDLVAVHSHVKQSASDLGTAVMHIFRFEDDKITELWDFGQPVPSETVNENGMF
jgi:predicted SnoaL-like aldol condensation-catalyzing enzyme